MSPSAEFTEHGTAAQAGGEDAVAASEELLRSVFDSAPVGITVIGLDFRWLRVNREWCRMLGYERKELLGRFLSDFTHPDDLLEDRRRLTGMAAGELDGQAIDKRYLHKNGSVLWVHVHTEMIRNPAGAPLYLDPNVRPPAGDLGQFWPFVPGVATSEFYDYFHTDQETPEVVPWVGLQATTRAYAKIIEEANKLPLSTLQRPPERDAH